MEKSGNSTPFGEFNRVFDWKGETSEVFVVGTSVSSYVRVKLS